MEREMYERIKSEANNAREAESLCGKYNVEFHPLICEAANNNEICGHIRRSERERIISAFFPDGAK